MDERQEFLEEALAIITEVAPIFRKSFGAPRQISRKKDSLGSIVTDVDMALEKMISEKIRSKYPDHTIVGEELSPLKKADENYVWYIDPIDGTTNYANAVPFCCSSLALWKNNLPLVGIIANPLADEIFYATKKGGAFLNHKKISVSDVEKLSSAIGSIGWQKKESGARIFSKIVSSAKKCRVFASDALSLCLVAAGRLDYFAREGLNMWDVAAGAIILEEAGGKVTDWDGFEINKSSKNLAASNGLFHQELLRALS